MGADRAASTSCFIRLLLLLFLLPLVWLLRVLPLRLLVADVDAAIRALMLSSIRGDMVSLHQRTSIQKAQAGDLLLVFVLYLYCIFSSELSVAVRWLKTSGALVGYGKLNTRRDRWS